MTLFEGSVVTGTRSFFGSVRVLDGRIEEITEADGRRGASPEITEADGRRGASPEITEADGRRGAGPEITEADGRRGAGPEERGGRRGAGPEERGVCIPGAFDAHVHINEPGRTEWEGFETATKAAVAGGTTMLVDMPLNCIPATTNISALNEKIASTEGKLHCNVGFWGGAVPGNRNELRELLRGGVLGFKCFMVPSGVDEFDFVPTADLIEAIEEITTLNSVLLAHAEDPLEIEKNQRHWTGRDATKYAVYLATRSEEAEASAVRTLIEQSRRTGCHVHVVHVAAIAALEEIALAKQDGVNITAETCTHYLHFCSDDVPPCGTEYKCAPPIRSANVREALWDALGNGTLDFVTTDHSPSPPDLKSVDTGRFDTAWGGIASVQLFFSVVHTGASRRGYSLQDVVRWCCVKPALFAGQKDRGDLDVGFVADAFVFDPSASFTVSADDLFHRHKLSPYVGETLLGRVQKTWVSGEIAWDGSAHLGRHGKVV